MLEIITKSEDYKQFIKDYDPFIIFLGGSRGNQYNNPNSDWDLIAFTDKYKGPFRKCERVHFKNLPNNIRCHTVVISLEMVFDVLTCSPEHTDHLWEFVGLMLNLVWNDHNKIIYENNIPSVFKEIINPDLHLREHFLHSLVVSYGPLMRHMIEAFAKQDLDVYYKTYYYFLLMWEIYSGDNSYQPLIKKVRLHQPLEEQDFKDFITVLNNILNVAEQYDIKNYCADYLYLGELIWQHLDSTHPLLHE